MRENACEPSLVRKHWQELAELELTKEQANLVGKGCAGPPVALDGAPLTDAQVLPRGVFLEMPHWHLPRSEPRYFIAGPGSKHETGAGRAAAADAQGGGAWARGECLSIRTEHVPSSLCKRHQRDPVSVCSCAALNANHSCKS